VHSKVIGLACPLRHLKQYLYTSIQMTIMCPLRCPLQLRITKKIVKYKVYFLILNDELPKISALLGTMPH
jgi:hypothetical protein